MARIEKINNITDLTAFIYDPETLPTALISVGDAKMAVSSLREAELGVLEQCLKHVDCKVDPKTGELSIEAKAYRFYEDARYTGVCYAAHFSAKLEGRKFANVEEWASKTFDMCA